MHAAVGEIQRVASMRESGSMWRRGDDVFRSSREEDDEEALRWAALEKLPTYDRLRRAILPFDEDGEVVADAAGAGKGLVDVLGLGPHERRALVERLVRVADEDNERFLLKLKDRVERVGIDMPTIEVRFEHLEAEAEVRVGNSGFPTVLNSIINTLEEAGNALHLLPNRKQTMPILHDVSGIIKPRRMALLLGPPGSGKTTLLLALAGRLDKDLKVCRKTTSLATISGAFQKQSIPQRRSVSAYHQIKSLFYLFVSAMSSDTLIELARREKAANIKPDADIDAFMKASMHLGTRDRSTRFFIIGLEICADTMVGDELRRGISGGQRKRLTTDVHNQLSFTVNNVLPSRDVLRNAISVNEFLGHSWDKILNSTASNQTLGVQVLESRGMFPEAKWYWIGFGALLGFTMLFNALFTLALTFLRRDVTWAATFFRRNKALIKELSQPAPGSSDLYFPTKYSQSFFTQCLVCLWKQNLSYWRNPPYNTIRFFFTTISALLFGTIFWDLGRKVESSQDLFDAMGSMYAAVLFIGVMNCTSVQPVVAVERTVFYRERAAGMYSAFPYAFGQRVPIWWRWYCWVCPVAWTLYGLVVSQFGDNETLMEDQTSVKVFVEDYFGFKHSWLGWVAAVVAAFALLFASLFGFAIMKFNFQNR
ncbi:hypothetical protein ABZP36_017116 [Zizania latifolia]